MADRSKIECEDATEMKWPTLWHKFGAPRFWRWPCWAGFSVAFRDWYFGNYILISFGWFAFACGCGIYEDVEAARAGALLDGREWRQFPGDVRDD